MIRYAPRTKGEDTREAWERYPNKWRIIAHKTAWVMFDGPDDWIVWREASMEERDRWVEGR
ncbi:MAG: hypothetical protein ACREVA_00085 [Burkholderiales bacterium]